MGIVLLTDYSVNLTNEEFIHICQKICQTIRLLNHFLKSLICPENRKHMLDPLEKTVISMRPEFILFPRQLHRSHTRSVSLIGFLDLKKSVNSSLKVVPFLLLLAVAFNKNHKMLLGE